MLEYDRSLMLLSPGICTSMASQQQQHPHAAAQVAEKVMRRVEIAKVAHPPPLNFFEAPKETWTDF